MSTRVFISWSGSLSRQLGEAVRNWLPGVLQFAKPYFTPDDIEKGARWNDDISRELDQSNVGIICLTPENIERPWVLFEAGALSKSLDKGRACTLLFDVDPADFSGPLAMFQHTRFQREDVAKLVKAINSCGGEAKLDDTILSDVFEMWWPKLEGKVNEVLKGHAAAAPPDGRPEREILEEILELARLSARSPKQSTKVNPGVIDDLLRGVITMIRSAHSGGSDELRMAIHSIDDPLRYLVSRFGHADHRLMWARALNELELAPASWWRPDNVVRDPGDAGEP